MKSRFLKNLSYVFFSNGLCVLINVIVNFLLPIRFSNTAYAYYQLENLYCSYLWIVPLGWHEGILLHYGGRIKNEFDRSGFATQFWLLLFYMGAAALLVGGAAGLFSVSPQKTYVFRMSVMSIMLEAARYMFLYYLICFDFTKKYAGYTLADRVLYLLLLFMLILCEGTDYRLLIGADIVSKFIMLAAVVLLNRNLFFVRLLPVRRALYQTKRLISSGIQIMLSSYVGQLVNAIVRFAIDACWGILVFGKISLTLSISNMFTQLIQSVSVVLFPALAKKEDDQMEAVYLVLSHTLDLLMLTLFAFYFPLVKVLGYLLPQYRDGLHYMAILFPVCLYDARAHVINNTYLKALRKEGNMLVCNLVAAGCSVIFTLFSTVVLHNLDVAVMSIVLLVAIKNLCLEYVVSRFVKIPFVKNIFSEFMMTVIFIFANWTLDGIKGTAVYAGAFLVYCFANRKNIQNIFCYCRKRTGFS